jgi:hypothetical protein
LRNDHLVDCFGYDNLGFVLNCLVSYLGHS